MIAIPRERVLRGRTVLAIFVGFFLIVLGANAAMMIFAFRSFSGLTATEPYTKGLRHNEELARAEAQARLGWQVEVNFAADGQRAAAATVRIRDRSGAPLRDAAVAADFVRPLERHLDFAAAFRPGEDGNHAARVAFPAPGQWEMRLRIVRGAERHDDRVRIDIR